MITACINSSVKKEEAKDKTEFTKQVLTKPPAGYHDTLKINYPSAVFYHADSLQLQKIKNITDNNIYEGSMHEYFYQMRNARMVLKKNWPGIKIIEAKHVRYLLFKKPDSNSVCIDLNTKNDPYGLFLFDARKNPLLADMMNIDSQLAFYFAR